MQVRRLHRCREIAKLLACVLLCFAPHSQSPFPKSCLGVRVRTLGEGSKLHLVVPLLRVGRAQKPAGTPKERSASPLQEGQGSSEPVQARQSLAPPSSQCLVL